MTLKICIAINKETQKYFSSYFDQGVVCVVVTKNKGAEPHMKKAIIPTAILCAAVCIGLHKQPSQAEETMPAPEPPQVEVMATPIPTPEVEIEEPVIEIIEPTPESTPKPAIQQPVTNQSVQAGDMVYVPGFGWFESQGEGTVTYDETMRENGNKVGIMG